MVNPKLLLLLLITFLFISQSCSDDDPCSNISCLNGGICLSGLCDCPTGYSGPQCENFDPCTNIVCLNGGVCANGLCNCPPGYTGSDCSVEQSPVQMTITKIDVLNYPVLNSSGGGWDLTTGADPYITMTQGTSSNTSDYITGYVEDVTGNPYSITLTTPKIVNNLSSNWTIAMYDYDTPDADDFMAGVYFVPISKSSGFPSNFVLNTGTIELRLFVTWSV